MKQKELVPKRRYKGYSSDWQLRKWIDTVDISTNMVDPRTGKYDELLHLGPGNIESFTGRILDNIKKVKNENLISGKFVFNPGDVIYGKINPQLGKYVLSNFEGLASADAYVLNTKNEVSQDFLYRILQVSSFYKYSVSVSSRTGMPKINRDELNQYSFLAPLLEEQQKIGQFFKHLDEMITLEQRKIDKTKALKSAYLAEMFPAEGERVPKRRFAGFTGEWNKKRIGDISDSFSGGTPSAGNKLFYGGFIPFIRSGEVNAEKTELFITDEGLKNSSAKLVEKGDVLYALYGATSGEVGISNINGAINQAVLAIKPNEDNSYFITQWLRKQKKFIIEKYLQGGQGNLSGNIVKQLMIDLPNDRKEQQKIGLFFKKIDDTILNHQFKIEKLKATKQAYLNEMFV